MQSRSIYGLVPHKNLSSRVNLLFIPALFLLFSFYNLSIQGPFYSFTNIDPSYAYLFNGFEILHFHAPGHVDHPGTTTQLLMSFVILFKWLFTVASCWLAQEPIPSLDHLFFTQPESFLVAGTATLILINTLLFSLVSLNLFYHAKKQAVVFAFQLGLFLFFPVIKTFSQFTPEPMLLTGFLWLSLVLLPVLFSQHEVPKNTGLSIGIALGFSLATKVTCLPLIGLIFLFPTSHFKQIIKYILISFMIFTFPIWVQYLSMIKWLIKISLHDGLYGTGSVGLINITKLSVHLQAIHHAVPFLWILIIGVSTYLIFAYKKHTAISFKFILLSLIAMIFSLLLNLKHPGIHYMMPVLLLGALAFAVIVHQLNNHPLVYKTGVFLTLFIGLGLSYQAYQPWHQEKLLETQGRAAFQAYVDTNQCKVIGFYHPSMQSYAQFFGDQWASKKRAAILSQYHPNNLFFEAGAQQFFNFQGPKHPLDSTLVELELKKYPCIVFQGLDLNLPKESPYQAKLIEKSLDNHKTVAAKFYEFKTG